jgi:hypothetical protein
MQPSQPTVTVSRKDQSREAVEYIGEPFSAPARDGPTDAPSSICVNAKRPQTLGLVVGAGPSSTRGRRDP